MEASSTDMIVQALTRAIVDHRLQAGSKLAEQALADHFGVSRTLVRQALFQLSQKRLVRLAPSRGAFVASPSIDEARQVFAVRRMLEVELTRAFVRAATPGHIEALRAHVRQEQAAVVRGDALGWVNTYASSPCARAVKRRWSNFCGCCGSAEMLLK